jgi:phospholipid/cholesterol/gamma-HCH transport system substrate-binding protein
VTAIRKQLGNVAAILGLMVLSLAIGLYIAQQQRLRIPFVDPKPMRIDVELANAQAVTPGQGQSAQVAGVQIGLVGDVRLKDGRAIVGLDIEPEYADLIHTDARALLRPRTGLKDMYVQIFPGSPEKPLVKEGFTIPLSRTLTDVDLDEILAVLDERTLDYVKLLVNGTGRGLRRRGSDLAEVFKRFEPTVADLERVNRAVASERDALERSITSLARINGRLARRPEDLTQLVDFSAATFEAFASEDDRLRETISELAPSLQQATSTLRDVRPFADQLGPATRELVPAFRELDRANRAVRPFAREATPILREEIRPFVRASRPLVRDLRPAAAGLADRSFPEFTRTGRVLNRFFNMLGFNPNGREPASKPDREEGYLFWTAWASHQGVNLQNIDDANGPIRPVFLTGTCTTLVSLVNDNPELEFLMNLSPVLATACGDPETASLLPELPELPELPDLPVNAKEAGGR